MTETSRGTIASFHLIRYAELGAMRYMAFDRPVLRSTPGLLFWRLLGSGRGASMSLGADLRRWALLAVWRRESALDDFLDGSPMAVRWRQEALESWQVRLEPLSSRGSWGGVEPFGPALGKARRIGEVRAVQAGAARADRAGEIQADQAGADGTTGKVPGPVTGNPGGSGEGGPVAVLTRASIRPSRLVPFYRSVPRVDRLLREQDGCLASVGVGEWPLVRQATFSLWRDADAVRDFAYRGRAHRQVIGRTRGEDWYSEELFARFSPYGSEGTWNGADPLA
ncbi:spheroidene monooxygenase [Streptosporangium sp. NBC_01756]|uniref:spheroidene monooxygenase n=1 Tax=Streptosporangium sp. NBC_01756 TaxID=2975950 RepID=UPI002DDA1933|nr:spheroidene monooxygenase [Streptosporangium sp. NBC_01756]WSC85924.1 spheroidene monooxygenase [Streptosporangium sp. NBC_01756]